MELAQGSVHARVFVFVETRKQNESRTWVEVCIPGLYLGGLYKQGVVVGDALDVACQHVVREQLHDMWS